MVHPGHPNPPGGTQSIQHSLLQSNSGMMTSQGSATASQTPRTQFGYMNMLGNVPNVSSLLHHSFPNGPPNPGFSGPGNSQWALMDNGAEVDILSGVGNRMGFNQPSSSLTSNTSGQVQAQQISNMFGNQMLTNPHQSEQLDPRNFHHNQQQISVHNSNQQQQQFQMIRDGLGAAGPVRMELQMVYDQTSQQLQTLRNLNSVLLESELQGMRSLPQDPSMFLQQQQQQFLQWARQNTQAVEILQQQRLLNNLKSMPLQRSTLEPQFPSENLPIRSTVRPIYEPGACARRLTHYLFQQQHRPADNNIDFWKKFVAEFFAPNAKIKWCFSMYGTGQKISGVFPQDLWHCEICNRKPGCGFEANVEVLPRLFKIKYDSGTLEELLYLDMPREYQNSSGQIVLDYAKAVEQSVFEKVQVVRDGQLRLVFSSDLKICSWEFCARRHEELIPKKLLVPQVNQLGVAVQKYKDTTKNSSSKPSVSDLQNICNMFVASANPLAKALDGPLVNDLGYTKSYVRCLQISDVANSMKDLIDYSIENNIGPMESLATFPLRSSSSLGNQRQQPEDQIQRPHLPSQQQQTAGQNSNNDLSSQNPAMQIGSSNRASHANNNTINPTPSGFSATNIARLMHQNSMNSRQRNLAHGSNNPCDDNGVQIPFPGSSIPRFEANLPTFHFPTTSTSTHLPHTSHGGISAGAHISSADSSNNISIQQPALTGDVDGNNSMGINERVGVALSRDRSKKQRNQMFRGLETKNGCNNPQFN